MPQREADRQLQILESQGVDILKTEKNNPIIILEPGNTYRRKDGTTGQNYYAKEVYDISQTSAQGQEQPKSRFGRAPFAESPDPQIPGCDSCGRAASRWAARRAVPAGAEHHFCGKGYGRCGHLPVRIAGACQGAAYGSQPGASPCGVRQQAFCVSYMLCKKYGIDTRESYDCSKLGGIFAGKKIDTIKADLGDMENAMDAINSRMAKALYQEKIKARATAPTTNGKEGMKWRNRKRLF